MEKFKFTKKVFLQQKTNSKRRKLLSTLYLLLFIYHLSMPVLALELDTSIDDTIRKNYNPDKIEQDLDLPPLPNIIKKEIPQQQTKNSTQLSKNIQQTPALAPIQTSGLLNKNHVTYAVLKKGTKISLKLLTNVSDRSATGSTVSFVSLYPVTTTYFTIPMGTKFTGKVINTHGPQFTGNGGLIVIEIDSMIINDEIQPINAHVTKVNDKYIFLNNIKGQRKYAKGMLQSIKPGRHFMTKMIRISGNLAIDGSSIFLSPFALALGAIGLGGNIFISPALGLFYKGAPVRINSGSEVDIKLSEDVNIYN